MGEIHAKRTRLTKLLGILKIVFSRILSEGLGMK